MTRARTWFDDRGLVIAASTLSAATGPDAIVSTNATSTDVSTSAPGAASGTTLLGTRHLPFYAGAMHYWRVPRAQWSACLRTMHAQGLTIVESYVPWRVHAPAPDVYDWTGDRDLRAFIAAADAAGLRVVLRLGPHVNAELTSFGIPDHVLADEACQARTSRGTPAWMPAPPRAFPIPSYASRAFHAKVADWYAEVARVVGASSSATPISSPRSGASSSASEPSRTSGSLAGSSSSSQTGASLLAPEGPVVAIGVDNEAQLFFRAGAYDLDYHPDAIEWWRDSTGIERDPPRD